MSKRELIVSELGEKTGMSFTALRDATDLGHGTIQHHIRNSSKIQKRKNAVVHAEKCRECPFRGKCMENCIFKLLENKSRRKIIREKLSGLKNVEIAEETGLHRSTVTFHLSEFPELDEEFRKDLGEVLKE